ncbi:MAG: hypothetical protein WBA51_09245 [Erythrobacter sp.]
MGQFALHLARHLPADALVLRASVALSSSNIAADAAKLGLEIETGVRHDPGAASLTWRHAGAQASIAEGLPFIIQYDQPEGRLHGAPSNGDLSISAVTIVCPAEKLDAYLGAKRDVQFAAMPGTNGVRHLTVRDHQKSHEIAIASITAKEVAHG